MIKERCARLVLYVLSSECAQSIFLGGPFSEHNVMHVRYVKGGKVRRCHS